MKYAVTILAVTMTACPVFAGPTKTKTPSSTEVAKRIINDVAVKSTVTVKGQPKQVVKVRLVSRFDRQKSVNQKTLGKRKAQRLTSQRKAATHIRVGHGKCLGSATCR